MRFHATIALLSLAASSSEHEGSSLLQMQAAKSLDGEDCLAKKCQPKVFPPDAKPFNTPGCQGPVDRPRNCEGCLRESTDGIKMCFWGKKANPSTCASKNGVWCPHQSQPAPPATPPVKSASPAKPFNTPSCQGPVDRPRSCKGCLRESTDGIKMCFWGKKANPSTCASKTGVWCPHQSQPAPPATPAVKPAPPAKPFNTPSCQGPVDLPRSCKGCLRESTDGIKMCFWGKKANPSTCASKNGVWCPHQMQPALPAKPPVMPVAPPAKPQVKPSTPVKLPVRLPPSQFNVVPDGCKGFKNINEDCTNRDLFILKTNTNGFVAPTFKPDQYGSDEIWETVKVQDSDWKAMCVAYVNTRGGTCKTFCESNGKKCVRAMDDAHTQTAGLSKWLKTGGYKPTDCTLLPSLHSRQSQAENGCNQRWGTQMCACN